MRNYLKSIISFHLFRFCVILSFFILMGLPWIIYCTMEIISLVPDTFTNHSYITMANDLLNMVTCVFIFVRFACKPKVWKWIKVKFPCLERLTCRSSFIIHKFRLVKGLIGSSGNTSRGANDTNGVSNEIEMID